jgi:hypothetical protein
MDIALTVFISYFAGAATVCIIGHALGKRMLRMAKALEEAGQGLRKPAFEIPIELDRERVVEVGYAQAIREEAQRIGRLN